MADFSNMLDKNFKVAALEKPVKLTVKEVKAEPVGMDKEVKPVMYFIEDPRGLVLNNTRYGAMAASHRCRDTERWKGAVIELSVDPTVRFQGKICGGLVVKVLTPSPNALKS